VHRLLDFTILNNTRFLDLEATSILGERKESENRELCVVCQTVWNELSRDVSNYIEEHDDESQLTEFMKKFLYPHKTYTRTSGCGGGARGSDTTPGKPHDARLKTEAKSTESSKTDDIQNLASEPGSDDSESEESSNESSHLSQLDSLSLGWNGSDDGEDGFEGAFKDMKWTYKHYKNFDIFRRSAGDGCPLCYKFLLSVEDDEDLEEMQKRHHEDPGGG
jgi:hypothetical protein